MKKIILSMLIGIISAMLMYLLFALCNHDFNTAHWYCSDVDGVKNYNFISFLSWIFMVISFWIGAGVTYYEIKY